MAHIVRGPNIDKNFSSSYTAPTPLSIRQEVERSKAKVFYSTFLNFLISGFYVFDIFPEPFFVHLWLGPSDSRGKMLRRRVS